AESLLAALTDARAVELALLESLTDEQMLGTRAHFIEPPIWEMGHVGWFQEYWILRHLDGAAPLLPGSDAIYDAFHVSYLRRRAHDHPPHEATVRYYAEVVRRSIYRLGPGRVTDKDAYFYTLAALHEDMHAENLTLILQTHGYRLPAFGRMNGPIPA